MYKIVKKRVLNQQMTLLRIDAPHIAKKALPGQFIIIRIDELGERVPFTIAAYDGEQGTIDIIYQTVGYSTKLLDTLNQGDYILDVVGPLGKASELEGYKNAVVVGGGTGCAIALPQAKALKELGANVTMVAGFRNKDIIILEDEMKDASNQLVIMTDDGSNGNKGFVTGALKDILDNDKTVDFVIAIGPLPMMKAVCDLTKEYGIKTIVSMNSIMIDGTGMCGGCRVTVGGEIKFACVDGPDFDGHLVDFDEAIKRGRMYVDQERAANEHTCRLTGDKHNG
ncbi:MAG: sulfide/dihydroorotate dehydrogenase-like FAD/NAD-binding protein [Clostridia bacterium]|nr:sulfide/dihydroorotate dehydrogenase-like FAD/NAD-binding protein [Clostridia bacterium]